MIPPAAIAVIEASIHEWHRSVLPEFVRAEAEQIALDLAYEGYWIEPDQNRRARGNPNPAARPTRKAS